MKEWLSGIVGEGTANIVGFILIFAIILGGIFVVLSLIRRFGGGFSATAARSRQPRLSVMDAAAVDSRRKLVLIRRDDVEHLLLIGGPTDVVVEQNIGREDRAAPRLQQTSRIEPERIERFRQHEAAIAGDRNEHPALSSRNPAAPEQPERDEAIQLSSAIETPMQRQQEPEPEPEKEEPVRQQPAAAQRPQPPRAAPNIPPLPPRTVVPPRPQPPQAQSARAHPAYPLSQVSRGVVSATSSASNAAVAPAAAAAASLGAITRSAPTGRAITATATSAKAIIGKAIIVMAKDAAAMSPAAHRRSSPQRRRSPAPPTRPRPSRPSPRSRRKWRSAAKVPVRPDGPGAESGGRVDEHSRFRWGRNWPFRQRT